MVVPLNHPFLDGVFPYKPPFTKILQSLVPRFFLQGQTIAHVAMQPEPWAASGRGREDVEGLTDQPPRQVGNLEMGVSVDGGTPKWMVYKGQFH